VSNPGRWIFILDAGRSGGRYVQVLVYEDGSIVAEASSNNFLEGSDCLSAEQEKMLLTMGWHEPHLPGKPNWWSVQATINRIRKRSPASFSGPLMWLQLCSSDVIAGRVFSSPRRGNTPATGW